MLLFLTSIIKTITNLFKSKRSLLYRLALIEKENEILKRQRAGKRIRLDYFDKLYIVMLNITGNIKNHISIVQPETVLKWQRKLIKYFCTFKQEPRKRGRKPVLWIYSIR